jgi:hypothetical protein
LLPEDGKNFQQVQLSLHVNGYSIKPLDQSRRPTIIAWSPFSLVQACRLHSMQADAALPWLRLFKVSVFHHGVTHFFAAQGEDADADRARWVADIARALRVLTQSLFPPFSMSMLPVFGAEWTSTRLLAGYMLLCNNQDVSLVYSELHAHIDSAAAFAVYKDEYCDARVMHIGIGVNTCVSERVGVDCSCFSVDGHHFATRSAQEKTLWLRAISNVKVKLRHRASNPSAEDLVHYREAIAESIQSVRCPPDDMSLSPILPRRAPRQVQVLPVSSQQPRPPAMGEDRNDQAEGSHKVPGTGYGGTLLRQSSSFDRFDRPVITLGPPETVPGDHPKHVENSAGPGKSIRGPSSKPPQTPFELESESPSDDRLGPPAPWVESGDAPQDLPASSSGECPVKPGKIIVSLEADDTNVFDSSGLINPDSGGRPQNSTVELI